MNFTKLCEQIIVANYKRRNGIDILDVMVHDISFDDDLKLIRIKYRCDFKKDPLGFSKFYYLNDLNEELIIEDIISCIEKGTDNFMIKDDKKLIDAISKLIIDRISGVTMFDVELKYTDIPTVFSVIAHVRYGHEKNPPAILTKMYSRLLSEEFVVHDFVEYVARGYSLDDGSIYTSIRLENVIFNGPATIAFWSDETKTVVKAKEGETFDPEKGLAMAICKKLLGNNVSGSNYYNIFKKWIPKEDDGGVKDE